MPASRVPLRPPPLTAQRRPVVRYGTDALGAVSGSPRRRFAALVAAPPPPPTVPRFSFGPRRISGKTASRP